ncbi:hypothetical protein [Streptomyces acidicola]|uniref:hypothetical protein n=1 Tax=Streptomyces acidicola TaxID=2596892 RepID=UPI00380F8C09
MPSPTGRGVIQLALRKLMIHQTYGAMVLHGTQILATLFDGITRHSPEGRWIPDGGGPIPTAANLVEG